MIFFFAALTFNAQQLTFKRDAIDAGLATWYKPLAVTYHYVNNNDFPVTVVDVDPGCGCLMPDWDKSPIKPGQEGKLVITYNAEMLGRFYRDIMIITDVSSQPQIIKLQCKVVPEEVEQYIDPDEEVKAPVIEEKTKVSETKDQPEIAFSTEFLVIGSSSSKKILKGEVVVQNKGKGLLVIEGIKSTSAELIVNDVKAVLKPKKKYKAKLMLNPMLLKDPKRPVDLHILSNDPNRPDATIKVACY